MAQKVQCPFCFEKFSVTLYPEDGETQDVTYDCEVCCHPIEIKAQWNHDLEKFVLLAEKSSGFD
jgi:Cysteine-rich CPXCG